MPLPESRQLDFDEIPVIDINRLKDSDGTAEVTRAIDRYSIPYFVDPSAEVIISALDGSESFSPFNYGDYQESKWRGFFPVDET